MEPAPVPARDICVYVSTKTAERRLGVQREALYRWAKAGWIEHHCTPGGHYRWDVEGYLRRKRAVIQPDRTVLHAGT